jgi:hypothetical protein
VARALARGDEGADELFEAVLDFLEAAPAELVAQSRGVVDGLVMEPLDFWVGSPAPTRAAFLAFLRRLVGSHPAVRNRLPAPSLAGLAVRLLQRRTSRRVDLAAGALLTLRWPLALLRRLRRRGRRPVGTRR